MSEVKPGQVWRDMDKRMNGRTLAVMKIDGDKAICAVGLSGRYTKISIRRMKPGSTGYELIRDENGIRVQSQEEQENGS